MNLPRWLRKSINYKDMDNADRRLQEQGFGFGFGFG